MCPGEKMKLKIGLFIDTWFPMVDGVIMVVDNYAKRLSEFCDVTVFCPKIKGSTKEFPYKLVQCKAMPICGLDYDLPLARLDRKFKKQIEKSNLDIVHIHSPFGVGKMGVSYAKKHNVPVVATMHSQFKQDFYKATKSKLLTKILLKNVMNTFNKCDEYYGVNARISEIFKEYGAKHLPLVQRNGTDLITIENGQDTINKINNIFDIPDNTAVLLFVGRIVALKNIFFIAKALKHLKEKSSDFKMIFVGEGQDMENLREKIKTLGLQNNVILTGKITDREMMKGLYLRAKLFLFPSMYDASSLVQIEAASQKTPTLFLKGSATSATVMPDINGFVCENSEEKYAEKIYEILTNEELYNKVSHGAYNDLYVTWDECVKEMFDKYIVNIKNKFC